MNINKAKLLKYSKNQAGRSIITFETETDCVTHTQMSQHTSGVNAAKSKRSQKAHIQIEEVESGYAYKPQVWWKDQIKGMQPTEYFAFKEHLRLNEEWKNWQQECVKFARYLHSKGVARQIVGKVIMPFKVIKAMWTFPDYGFDNFIELRAKEGTHAQHEINELALMMKKLRDKATPELLLDGEWHIPYSTPELPLAQNIRKSISCTAFMSYDSHEKERTAEKYKNFSNRLLEDKHMSCFMHIAQAKSGDGFHERLRGFSSLREELKHGRFKFDD